MDRVSERKRERDRAEKAREREKEEGCQKILKTESQKRDSENIEYHQKD